MLVGFLLVGFFAYELFTQNKAQDESLQEATERIGEANKMDFGFAEAKTLKSVERKETRENEEDETLVTGEVKDKVLVEDEVKNNGKSEHQKPTQEPTGTFQAGHMEAFAILKIPKIDKQLAIVEGADENALDRGVGHMEQTAYPGQGEQIVLAGHRDTVFRDFSELEIGDSFIVQMPYGEFKYEIRETEIVDADDTSVVRPMGKEVLVVSTCYPFSYFGSAPDRFVAYAYPLD